MMRSRRVVAAVVWLAVGVLACPAFGRAATSAAELAREMDPLLGSAWYGVYTGGGRQKCGFARITLKKEKVRGADAYVASMSMDVTIKMGLATQKLIMVQDRYYALSGQLVGFDTSSQSMLGKTKLSGEIQGGQLVVTATMAGHTSVKKLPRPTESLDAVLAPQRLIRQGKLGASATFQLFETSLLKPMTVTTKLLRFDERLLGGVNTRVAVLTTLYKEVGMRSTEYVTADGELLETVVAQMFTLRREPERVAKNVKFAFDAMRAGVIRVDKPLGDPRRVTSLKLRLSGVRRKELLIDDARQSYERGGTEAGATHTVTLRTALRPAKPLRLPITPRADQPEVARFLKPSTFAQSDAPEIVKAARTIVGTTTDSFEAACKVQSWVFRHVRKRGMAAMSNALAVLRKRQGDCSEHSILFVALCRAAGIPARQVVGIGYSKAMKGFGYHAWAEVYVGKWVAMDPTWGETLADATHVKFGVGDTDSLGVVAGLFGSLKIEVVEFKTKP